MAEDPKYITRLMRIRCDKGTMDNYINIETDHGVVAGADQQPVLNANDHTDKNIIHCGNCESDENPERMFRKAAVSALMGPAGFFIGDAVTDLLEDVGIMTCKCRPNTPVPWIFTNESNVLDGAPALTMDSKVACRYGGVIEFVPLEEYPEEMAEEAEGEGQTETEEAERENAAAADSEAAAAVGAAMAAIGEAVSFEKIKGILEDASLEIGKKQLKILQGVVSGVDPMVQVVREWQSHKTGTKAVGISASATPSIFVFDIGIVVAADHQGNIGIQWTPGGGVTAGTPSANLGITVQETNAADIESLTGEGYNLGGSVGAEYMLGGDFNIIPRKDGGYYYELTVTGGLGAGGEVHAAWGETKEIECLNINIYDAWDKFKETVEGMEMEDRKHG